MMMVAFGRNAEAALDRAREARFASPSKVLLRTAFDSLAFLFPHPLPLLRR